MKKIIYSLSCLLAIGAMSSCGGGSTTKTDNDAAANDSIKKAPEYTIMDNKDVDIATFPKDKDGYIVLFDGKTFNGWRGYGRNDVPAKWTVEDGCIKFNGSGGGEAQDKSGGDILFAHKFQNFELEFEWKISKGGNSGVFYLGQEVQTKDTKTGDIRTEPIYISAPEFQVLDNANHPDAKLGKNNNRQAASLYDMIPAVPQNAKPFGEWNKGKILVYKGTVVHNQNGENVLEYHLWTPQWTDMLQASKFSEEKWPLAFELLNNCGGEKREGYIAFQDHGDDVWFRNIRVKVSE